MFTFGRTPVNDVNISARATLRTPVQFVDPAQPPDSYHLRRRMRLSRRLRPLALIASRASTCAASCDRLTQPQRIMHRRDLTVAHHVRQLRRIVENAHHRCRHYISTRLGRMEEAHNRPHGLYGISQQAIKNFPRQIRDRHSLHTVILYPQIVIKGASHVHLVPHRSRQSERANACAAGA